jgi:hypothetical protein
MPSNGRRFGWVLLQVPVACRTRGADSSLEGRPCCLCRVLFRYMPMASVEAVLRLRSLLDSTRAHQSVQAAALGDSVESTNEHRE